MESWFTELSAIDVSEHIEDCFQPIKFYLKNA